MKKEIILETMPGFETSVKVTKLNVNKGDVVKEGDILIVLEGNKCTEEIKADEACKILEIKVKEGDELKEKSELLLVKLIEEKTEIEDTVKEIKIDSLPGFDTSSKVEKINIQVGDELKEEDIILVLEGAKTTQEFKSTYEGEVIELLVDEGEEVQVDTVVAKIKTKKGSKSLDKSDIKDKKYHAEVVVLGGGPGGYVAGIRASQRGKSVIIIEEDNLGGTCLNRGCIPTKSMVKSVSVKDTINSASIFGIEDASGTFNMNKIMDRKEDVIKTLVSGLNCSMENHKIKVLNGKGKIYDEETLIVDLKGEKAKVTYDDLILAPGSIVSIPKFEGSEGKDNLTSDELLELREIPESLIIIGGRVIAMEFAFIYRKLGTKVTVIQRSDTIFPSLDEDIIKEVRESALNLGINLVEGTNIKRILTTIDNQKALVFEKNGKEEIISAEKLAIATGRKPNLEGLDLEKLGVEIDKNTWGIKVNSKMQTNIENIYAIGDATNIYNLAHVASKQGLVAVENICGKDVDMDYSAIPEAVFTDPEIGICGMSEKMCKEEGIEYIVGKFPYLANGKALVENETKGFIKVIARKDNREIIGAGLVGALATELLSVYANLIENKVTIDKAKEVVYAHPTVSETAFEAVLDLDNEALHK